MADHLPSKRWQIWAGAGLLAILGLVGGRNTKTDEETLKQINQLADAGNREEARRLQEGLQPQSEGRGKALRPLTLEVAFDIALSLSFGPYDGAGSLKIVASSF